MAKVVGVEPGDPRWNRYVEKHARASAYHLGEWAAILGSTYGVTPRYLALEDGGELRGVFPLVQSTGLLFGRRLRSLPVVRIAGPLGATIEDEARLLKAACEMAGEIQARELVVQSTRDGYLDLLSGLVKRNKHPTWITELPGDPDSLRAQWRKNSKNLHRNLNKAERSSVTVRESRSEEEMRSFYRLYLATMKTHRSLPRPYRQLARARGLLAPRGVFRLFVAEHEGQVVAGGVFHAFNGTLELQYNASDASALDLRPNHALYWHAIRWAIDQGLHRFDWGEARPGSTLAQFKAQWSAERVQEHRYHWIRDQRADRATSVREAGDLGRSVGTSRRERVVAKAWDRSPLALTRAAGAVVYRFL
jgi:CelD/BcsL family acetyltransferase involved in cellulose biosynthesis